MGKGSGSGCHGGGGKQNCADFEMLAGIRNQIAIETYFA
jgi:hypothetical protein